MPVFEILHESDTAFICGIEGWLQSSREKHEWQQLVIHFIQYAFTSRPVTLITISPMQWSIGYLLPEPHLMRKHQSKYLVNHIEDCSAQMLADIAESEDFQRGLLWFWGANSTDEHQLLAIISQLDVTSSAPTAPNNELLLLLDDGRRIYWLNPSRDVKTLEDELLKIVRTFGWEVSE